MKKYLQPLLNNLKILPLLATIALLISSPAYASDVTKYNAKGDSPVKRVSINLAKSKRILYLKSGVSQNSVKPVIDGIKELSASSKADIYLIITSPGGSVLDGFQLINTMTGAKATLGVKTICIVESAAYSMAALIQSYCHQAYMTPNSSLLYHEAAYQVQDQMTHMISRMKFMDQFMKETNANVARQMGMPADEYEREINKELWYTSESAARYGITDGIIEGLYYVEPKKKEVSIFDLLEKLGIKYHDPVRKIEVK